MSDQKYKFLRSSLKDLYPDVLPRMLSINTLKYQLEHYFKIQENGNRMGFYTEPEHKIEFVCKKFLERNPKFKKSKFRIKLAADSTSISSTHINLLNLAFSLLDDIETATNVNGCYILG